MHCEVCDSQEDVKEYDGLVLCSECRELDLQKDESYKQDNYFNWFNL